VAISADTTYGDRRVTANVLQWSSFSVMRHSPPSSVAAGAHTATLQLARVSADGVECSIDSADNSAVQLQITVR
jgi:hypothetical protein